MENKDTSQETPDTTEVRRSENSTDYGMIFGKIVVDSFIILLFIPAFIMGLLSVGALVYKLSQLVNLK